MFSSKALPAPYNVYDLYSGQHFFDILDVDIAYPLKEDFVWLEMIYDNNPIIEYHMYPIKTLPKLNEPIKLQQGKNNPMKTGKLNIVMLMMDSVSHASAKRYLNKTYPFLENDPDTVILKVGTSPFTIKHT